MDKILELEDRKRSVFLNHAGGVVFRALLRVRQHLVGAPQKEERFGVSGSRVIRMKPGSHESIHPMNSLDVRVAADL